jgi:hypothetical protein
LIGDCPDSAVKCPLIVVLQIVVTIREQQEGEDSKAVRF